MSRVQAFERRIETILRGLLRSPSPEQRRELIEVHRAILEEVASRVDSLPRGKRVFGYSHIRVEVLTERERRRSYEMVFLEGKALEHEIKGNFEEIGVECPGRLEVQVELVEDLPPEAQASRLPRGLQHRFDDICIRRAGRDPVDGSEWHGRTG